MKNENGYLKLVLSKHFGIKNPCRDVIMPKPVKADIKTLSDKEIAYLINNIQGDKVEVPVLLALWCGLRRGEVAGLRWQDVDFENSLIYVRQTKVKAVKGYQTKAPKSYEGTRAIHLPVYVAQKMKVLSRNHESDLIVDCVGEEIYHRFKKFLAKHPTLPNIRFHDLRHTFATVMLSEGIPDLFAAKVMGHSDTQMTRRYQHIRSKEQQRAEQTIDNFFISKLK